MSSCSNAYINIFSGIIMMIPFLLYLVIEDISQTRKKFAETYVPPKIDILSESQLLSSISKLFSSKSFIVICSIVVLFWPFSVLVNYFRNKQMAYDEKVKSLAEKAKAHLLSLASPTRYI
jgi:hypothetical protein